MSYWVSLHDDEGKHCIVSQSHNEGGTYAMGGTNLADLNVTYNYSVVYKLVEFSLWDLEGKTAEKTVSELRRVLNLLGDVPYNKDYWAPTPGNAGHVIAILYRWAQEHPKAIWSVR